MNKNLYKIIEKITRIMMTLIILYTDTNISTNNILTLNFEKEQYKLDNFEIVEKTKSYLLWCLTLSQYVYAGYETIFKVDEHKFPLIFHHIITILLIFIPILHLNYMNDQNNFIFGILLWILFIHDITDIGMYIVKYNYINFTHKLYFEVYSYLMLFAYFRLLLFFKFILIYASINFNYINYTYYLRDEQWNYIVNYNINNIGFILLFLLLIFHFTIYFFIALPLILKKYLNRCDQNLKKLN